MAFFLIPKYEKFTLNGFSWERSISIERFQTVSENGWYLPGGARMTNTKNELYRYNQVFSHNETKTRQISERVIADYETYVTGYSDLGNGTFREETSTRPVYETVYTTQTYEVPIYIPVPEYRTKYYYDIDKWLFERKIITNNNDKVPFWGELDLKNKERESSRDESYYIYTCRVKNKKKQQLYSIDHDSWLRLNKDDIVEAKVVLNHMTLKENSIHVENMEVAQE